MIKTKAIWVVSLVAVALLVIEVGYRLLEREQPHRVAPRASDLAEQVSDSSVDGRAASAAHAGEAGRSKAVAGRHGLHQRLLSMPEPERNQIFYLIIRDVGGTCAEVESSQYLIAENGAWHAHCGQIQTYSIVIDDFGSISVYPIPYGDFAYPMEVPELR